MEDAVEGAGAGDVLSAFADFEGLLEDVVHRAAGFGRTGDERGVVEEEQFLADVIGDFFEACGAVGAGVIEIEFIERDEAGCFFLEDDLGDFAVLRGDAGGEVLSLPVSRRNDLYLGRPRFHDRGVILGRQERRPPPQFRPGSRSAGLALLRDE